MRKQKKQFIVLLVLLVLVVIGYAGLRYYNREEEKKSDAEAEASKIAVTDLPISDITAFSYHKDGKQMEFRKEGDSWLYEDDKTMDLDEDVIEAMLKEAGAVNASEEITEYEELESYGLKEPSNTIGISAGEVKLTIYVGDRNEINSKYYIKREDSDSVYLVEAGFVTAFQKSLEDLIVKEEETEAPEGGIKSSEEG